MPSWRNPEFENFLNIFENLDLTELEKNCEMTKKEILEAVELYYKTSEVVFEGDATCFKILTSEEVEQNKREALARLQQASKEDLINYLIPDNICNDCLSEGS